VNEILGYISSALGGGLLTALIFIFAYSNKITKLTTEVEGLTKQINEHIKEGPVCAFHQSVYREVGSNASNIKHLERRIERLEGGRP